MGTNKDMKETISDEEIYREIYNMITRNIIEKAVTFCCYT